MGGGRGVLLLAAAMAIWALVGQFGARDAAVAQVVDRGGERDAHLPFEVGRKYIFISTQGGSIDGRVEEVRGRWVKVSDVFSPNQITWVSVDNMFAAKEWFPPLTPVPQREPEKSQVIIFGK